MLRRRKLSWRYRRNGSRKRPRKSCQSSYRLTGLRLRYAAQALRFPFVRFWFPGHLPDLSDGLVAQLAAPCRRDMRAELFTSAHLLTGFPQLCSTFRIVFPNIGGAFRGRIGRRTVIRPGNLGNQDIGPLRARRHPNDDNRGVGYRRRYPYVYGFTPLSMVMVFRWDTAFRTGTTRTTQALHSSLITHISLTTAPKITAPRVTLRKLQASLAANAPPPFRPEYQGEAVAPPCMPSPPQF